MARTGRRPGPSTTRDDVLAAARELFAGRGYDATTTRAVAARAGVDPALVVRTFGGKEGLFLAAVAWPWDPAVELAAVLDGDREGVGRRVVALFVRTWEDPDQRAPILALLRSAAAHDDARRLLAGFLGAQLLGPLVAALDVDEPGLRAALVGAQLVGLGTARHILGLEPLASADPARLVALVGDAVQATLTGPLPDPG
jgi:AcrR family transcriptional regulator